MSDQANNNRNRDDILADLADGTLAGPEWDIWLQSNPDAAAELAIARRTRALIVELRAASVPLPADFEARLLQLARSDTTVLDLLDLWLSGVGRVVVELVNLFLAFVPASSPAPATET